MCFSGKDDRVVTSGFVRLWQFKLILHLEGRLQLTVSYQLAHPGTSQNELIIIYWVNSFQASHSEKSALTCHYLNHDRMQVMPSMGIPCKVTTVLQLTFLNGILKQHPYEIIQ